jgi:hypothetical protein
LCMGMLGTPWGDLAKRRQTVVGVNRTRMRTGKPEIMNDDTLAANTMADKAETQAGHTVIIDAETQAGSTDFAWSLDDRVTEPMNYVARRR